MSVATSTAIGIAAGVGAAGSIGSAVLGSSASKHASDTQAAAADQAAQLQHQDAQAALQFQEQQYANSLGLIQPYYQSGTNAMSTLDQLLGMPGVQGNTSVFANPSGAQQPSGFPGFSGVGPLDFNAGGPSPSPMMRANAQGAQATVPAFDLANNGGDFVNDRMLQLRGGIPSAGGRSGPPVFDLNGNPVLQNGNPTVQANGSPAQLTVPNPAGNAAPGTIGNTGLPTGFLSRTFDQQFVPPTDVTEQNDPGFEFRLQLGQQAIENSAAARGGLLSGGTAKALTDFAQNDASAEYSNVYNRALNNYETAYNVFNQNQANIFNRYAALAGIGQTASGQLANAGLAAGGQVGNTLLTSGAQIGQQLNNAAAARASGYVGNANAFGSAFSNLGNLAQLIPLYNSLQNSSAAPGGLPTGDPSICWIAEALYGKDDIRTHLIRKWLLEVADKTVMGHRFVNLYRQYGERIGKAISRFPVLKMFFRPLFDRILSSAIAYSANVRVLPNPEVRRDDYEDYESVRYQIG